MVNGLAKLTAERFWEVVSTLVLAADAVALKKAPPVTAAQQVGLVNGLEKQLKVEVMRKILISISVGLLGLAPRSAWALNPGLPPGGNFDLSHWYLQLPTSNGILTGASGTVDSATTAQLVAGFTNVYFYTGPDGAMTFWAPDDGAHTGGSAHPRSELREELSPGATSVNWIPFGTHTMTATCVVSNIPADTMKVCIGQIHENAGAGVPMLMIMFYNNTIYADYWPDGNVDSSSSWQYGSFALGSTINYQMKVVNGMLSLAINGTTNTLDLFKNGANWQTNANAVYFKAGDYSQTADTCSCSNDGAKVAFYALTQHHAPAITNQPNNQAGAPGGNATFTVSALGNGTLSYQWLLNGSSLNGATNTSLLITNLSGANIGSYTVVVSDNTPDFNSVTGSVATLTGNFSPVITSQPSSQTISASNDATFSVGANGTAPLLYRWWFNTNNLLAATTNNYLTVTNAQTASAGNYLLTVSNSFGMVTSAVATLSVTGGTVSSTNLLLDALWLDGTRTNTGLPMDAAWYASAAASLIAVTNALVGLPDPAVTLTWWTYFTTNPASPVSLKVSDTLRVTLAFTPKGVNTNNTGRGVRLGLYNSSAGAQTLADGASPNGAYVLGYMLNMNFGQTFGIGSPLQFMERTNLPDGNLIGTVNDYATLGSGGPASGSEGFSNGIPYVLQYTVQRTTNSVNLTSTFTNTNGWSISYTATDTNNPTTAFDTFVFRPALQSQTTTNFTFTEFKVELVATNNHPPTPGNYNAVTAQSTTLSIPLTNLLAIASDPDGDTFIVTSVSALSTNHANLTLAGGNILYAPPNGYVGADQFTYTLTDYRGASGAGYVTVVVQARPLITSVRLAGNQSAFSLAGAGATNQPYVLWTASSLNPPVNWMPMATNSAAANGIFSFTDSQVTNFAQRFYRVSTP